MIAGVGSVSDIGSGLWRVGAVPTGHTGQYKDRLQQVDRWIPGGEEQEGYGQIGMKPVLSEAEQMQVDELKKRDKEVRTHEQAHAAALGSYAVGVPSYEFQIGPDGQAYAVGGSIKVNMDSTGNEDLDAMKAIKIRAAAGAAGEMSAADMAVAMEAGKGLGVSRQA